MQTISPFNHVRACSLSGRLYMDAYDHAEPDTVETLDDLAEEILDVSSEVADQLQRDAIGEMRHCNSGLKKPDSTLLYVYSTIGDVRLRMTVDLEVEEPVGMAIESVRVNLMKEAEDATS